MNKTDLIASVSASTGMPQEAAHRAVNATIEIIIDAIEDGDSVNLPGFGTFSTKLRGQKKGRNPQTGVEIDIPEATVPVFKPGKKLKEAAARK